MGCGFDDEVSVEGCADSLLQGNRGNHPTGFQAREGRLGHVGAGCEFDLGQSQGQAAGTARTAWDERADQPGTNPAGGVASSYEEAS